MVNGNNYSTSARAVSAIPDPASDYMDTGPTALGRDTPTGTDPARTDDTQDTVSLEQLSERVEDIAARLDSLIDTVASLIKPSAVNEETASDESIAQGIQAATEALIYTDFFQEALKLGMSPDIVADAYRLADISKVTVDLTTREVTGVTEALNYLLEKRPYLFFVKQNDVGLETNPLKGSSSHPLQVEELARTLGVSPEFAAELVKKRSEKSGGGSTLSDIWRVPRSNRLSFLETND